MRENNDMEILMQQKMEEFRMEPAPSDWQAIYEQLHPNKRRRYFWWWLPLAAGLSLFGAYLIFFGGQNRKTPDRPQLKAEIYQTDAETKTQTKPNPQTKATNNAGANNGSISAIDQDSNAKDGRKSGSANYPAKDISTQGANAVLKMLKAQAPNQAGSLPTSGREKSAHRSSTEPTYSYKKPTPIEPEVPVIPTTKSTKTEVTVLTTDTNLENLTSTKAEGKPITDSLGVGIAASTPKHPATDQPERVVTENESTRSSNPAPASNEKTNSIPRLSDHREKGWYLGLYTGLGVNDPTEPISMAKSADFISTPSSGSSYTTLNNQDKSGLHVALGLAIERKMKKMSMSTGLGLQLNSWSTNRTVYKDSISAGSFFNRTLIGNSSVDYKHLAIEIPLIMNFRIAGRKQNSYWLNLGLNNAITLKLDGKSEPMLAQGNTSFSLDNLPTDPSTYQPQLRLGLMYENAQKNFHFQLSPFMQYGLNNMTRSGNPDTRLLQFGLLGRYYFKKLR